MGYEGIYDITKSGRKQVTGTDTLMCIYIRNGERELYKTFDLWQKAFDKEDRSEYKGM